MTLLGTIVVGIALLLGALNGLRRGATKEVMALVGVLLGALLTTMWAARWGVVITQRTGWEQTTGQWLGSMVLLWVTALFSGYSSASLLPRSAARLSTLQRIAGAVLGLINASLLVGLSLRFTQTLIYGEAGNDIEMTWIRTGIASQFLLDRFDILVLGAAWTFAVISLIVMLFKLIQKFFAASRQVPPAPAKPVGTPKPTGEGAVIRDTPPAQPTHSSTTAAPGMERSFLDKPGGAPGRH